MSVIESRSIVEFFCCKAHGRFACLESEALRDGDRVGIPPAGNDREAMETAARLVRDAGFDPVTVGALARGKEFEPGTPPYNTGVGEREL